MQVSLSQSYNCAKAKIGEVMDGRYRVTEDVCGKGTFSNVIKAEDTTNKMQVDPSEPSRKGVCICICIYACMIMFTVYIYMNKDRRCTRHINSCNVVDTQIFIYGTCIYIHMSHIYIIYTHNLYVYNLYI